LIAVFLCRTTTTQTTHSGPTTKPPERLNFVQNHIFTQGHKETSYSLMTAQVIAKTMDYLNNLVLTTRKRRKIFIPGNIQSQEGIKKVWKEGL
jgi:hypothetical protein